MLIGLDFDNTLVSYDSVFYQAAVEKGLVPKTIAANKLAVRNYLRKKNQEQQWTLLQGYVYGACMEQAAAYSGVIEFFHWAKAQAIPLVIISHKTQYPFLGPAYDLHTAARSWISRNLGGAEPVLITPEKAYFETSKADKWARIAQCGCTHFIDDLPEILLDPAFPSSVVPLLFDPEFHHTDLDRVIVLHRWQALIDYFAACVTG